jgi:hypothetical protein
VSGWSRKGQTIGALLWTNHLVCRKRRTLPRPIRRDNASAERRSSIPFCTFHSPSSGIQDMSLIQLASTYIAKPPRCLEGEDELSLIRKIRTGNLRGQEVNDGAEEYICRDVEARNARRHLPPTLSPCNISNLDSRAQQANPDYPPGHLPSKNAEIASYADIHARVPETEADSSSLDRESFGDAGQSWELSSPRRSHSGSAPDDDFSPAYELPVTSTVSCTSSCLTSSSVPGDGEDNLSSADGLFLLAPGEHL